METTKGHILLVENDEDVRDRFDQILSMEGYSVYSCSNSVSAVNCYHANPIDLAVIDYRLTDNNDPNDKSGHHLSKQFDSQLVKVIMSAYNPNTFAQIEAPNTFQFNKEDGPEALVDCVNQKFDDIVQVNHDLVIRADFAIEKLFKQIKKFRRYNDQIHERQRFELEGLFKRLFYYEKEIKLKYIQPGYGGSGVVRVIPFYANEQENELTQGAEVVVKFGEDKNMTREFNRYSRFVETFLGMRATDVVGSMKISGSLAGIKFRLIGSQADWDKNDMVMSFKEAYSSLPHDSLKWVISDLFKNTCRLWYTGKYQAKGEKRNLAIEYKKHFNLETYERLDEVEVIIDSIANGEDQDRLTVKHFDERHLEFDFEHNIPGLGYPCILLNPLVLVEKHSDILPDIYYRSITHGDLNERNIFVDSNFQTWLIDFFKTSEGPALRDVIQLETAVKFFLYRETSLPKRLLFEAQALAPSHFDQLKETLVSSNGNERASSALLSIREEAAEINGNQDMTEYYAGMLFNTLRVMTLENIDPDLNDTETRIRRKHALFSAALLAQKFSHHI